MSRSIPVGDDMKCRISKCIGIHGYRNPDRSELLTAIDCCAVSALRQFIHAFRSTQGETGAIVYTRPRWNRALNVKLFKPEMLSIGTRHIQLLSLNRTCNVDCAMRTCKFKTNIKVIYLFTCWKIYSGLIRTFFRLFNWF